MRRRPPEQESDAERLTTTLIAYIGEHTGLSRDQIQSVFDAQNTFWTTWLVSSGFEVPWDG